MDSANTPLKFEIYVRGKLTRTEILTEKRILIGKNLSAQLRIDEEGVGRQQAKIEVIDSSNVTLLDMTGDTCKNGERVGGACQLKSGDVLTFGCVKLVVTIAGQAAPQRAQSDVRRAAVNAPLFDEVEDPQNKNHRVLEVLTLWGDTVLNVQHFDKPYKFLVGDVPQEIANKPEGRKLAKQLDQCIERGFLPQSPFPLAISDGAQMAVNVPDKVEGMVMEQGKIDTLEAMRGDGRLGMGTVPGSKTLRLSPSTHCRMKFGPLTLQVSSVTPPPSLQGGSFLKTLDLNFFKYLLIAVCLMALFCGVVVSVPADADSLKIDSFNLDDRFVEFLRPPEMESTKSQDLSELLKDLEKPEEEVAAAAAGEEGQMGKQDAAKTNNRAGIAGPAGNRELVIAQTKTAAIASATAAVANIEGQLSAIWGTGDRTIGSDAVNSFGAMFGDQIGENQGFGGLGLTGSGRGGGGFGTASIGIGTIGTVGRGGRGGGGSGYGNAQGAQGIRGGKPKIVAGKPTVVGSLDPNAIRRVIQSHQSATTNCYNKELQQKRDLAGKITLKFVIGPNGKVVRVEIAESTMKNANVEQCLRNLAKTWIFPEPKGGGNVTVNYPFTFSSN